MRDACCSIEGRTEAVSKHATGGVGGWEGRGEVGGDSPLFGLNEYVLLNR